MAVAAVGCGVAMLVDGRTLQGAPLWLKPFKFTVSLAVYSATLSWLLSLPHRGRRWTRGLGTASAVILVFDVGVVVMQAARGTFSHYNQSDDAFNELVGHAFGKSIPIMFLLNVALALVLSFQRFATPDVRWAVRSGLYLAVLGMFSGYLMAFQLDKRVTATDAAGRQVELVGGHSVGVPDGGPGMPVTAWSTTGGDLRVPHFVGMHGLQAMVLLAAALTALGLAERTRVRLVGVVAVGYLGLFCTLTWQALRGEPLVHPGGATLVALAAVAAWVAAGVTWSLRTRTATAPPPHPVPQPVR
ncbi:hypothetical protein EKG83_39310 [Saccharothrix syringae]|uniref:Uncharacterized protein n=2 Tax=Saccharothrix syringae TaxID=103733 RepID=A0A5Q0HGD3_SACSY|nr:hypothetical protein EKG83_39310 [Saccharothrix syringae]